MQIGLWYVASAPPRKRLKTQKEILNFCELILTLICNWLIDAQFSGKKIFLNLLNHIICLICIFLWTLSNDDDNINNNNIYDCLKYCPIVVLASLGILDHFFATMRLSTKRNLNGTPIDTS